MSGYLFTISLGPVQDFIAAARRTRDLWLGSLLLSECSKAAAQAVANIDGASLIFPNPDNTKLDLLPLSLNVLDQHPELASQTLNVANIILVELSAGLEPQQVADAAKAATKDCWKVFAKRAFLAGEQILVKDRWDEQVEKGVIECYCAWVPFDDGNYSQQRQRLMHLLAGRKALRNFEPWQGCRVAKSSLDGARETVLLSAVELVENLANEEELTLRLRLNGKEQLDALGFIKRAATKAGFPSVVRVAIDPWLRGVEQISDAEEAKTALKKIAAICKQEVKDEQGGYFAAGSGAHYRDTLFPYDGRVLFDEQRDSLKNALDNSEGKPGFVRSQFISAKTLQRLSEVQERLKAIGKQMEVIRAHLKQAGKPISPLSYYAILQADGDKMGETLNGIDNPEEHRKFSTQLAKFSLAARDIVNDQHNGCLVYAGGDDVLALLPVDQCLPCARALYQEFAELMREGLPKPLTLPVPTLSVGIAIGHCMEALGDMLGFAHAAEKDAKNPERNGLAVHLYTRGGDALKVRACWQSEPEKSLDHRLMVWAESHKKGCIPDGFAYALKNLIRDYAYWTDLDDLREALTHDALRLLSRKGKDSDKAGLDKVKLLFNTEIQETTTIQALLDSAQRIADEVILARRIAEALRQAPSGQAPVTQISGGQAWLIV